MLLRRSFELALTVAFAFVLAGCTDSNSEYTEVRNDESEIGHDDHGGHGHGHHGPNGGEIVEVGDEEFHAEVVVDEETHRIDVYILGSDAATAKPIDATEVSVSFKHGDEVEEFKLAAAALDGEPEGQSSKFTLADEELFEELHEHSEGATLTFLSGGAELSGTVKHSHDHGHGDSHVHGDDDHGDKHGDDDDDAHDDDHPAGDKDGEGHKHDKDDDGDEHGDKADSAVSKENKDPADSDKDKSDSSEVTKEAGTEDKPAEE